MRSNYKKLGINTVLFAVGSFAQKAMAFVFVPFYTSVLSTSDYGTSDLIVTVCSMIWPVFTIMINEAVLRFLLDKHSDRKQIVSIGMYINLCGLLIVLVLSPILFFVSTMKDYYILFILYYFAYMVNSFMTYTLRGLEKIKIFTVSGIICTALTISFNLIFLLVLNKGIHGYVLSFVFAFLITAVYQVLGSGLYKYILSPKKINIIYFKNMARYSVPLIPNSISWWISNSSDKLILTAVCGIAVNGVYSVAYKIPSMISVCSSIFSNAWQISAVDGYGTEDNRKFFSDIYYKYSAITAIMMAVILTLNKVICRILFAKEFYMAWVFAPILVLAVSFQILSGFLGTIYTTKKKKKMVFISTVIAALSNIALNCVLIPFFGGLGAAAATCISYMIVWGIRVVDSRKLMKLDINWTEEIITNIVLIFMVILNCMTGTFVWIISAVLTLNVFFMKRKVIIEIALMLKAAIMKQIR